MMKVFILLFLLFLPSLTYGKTFIEQKVNGHTFRVIQYPISSEMYDIKVVKTSTATPLWNLLKEHNAITGINGVFFCPTDYSWCNSEQSFTDNERYIEWEKFATYLTTWDRAVFWWTQEKVPFIYQSGKINMYSEHEIYYWLGNYPLLLNEWKNMLEEYWDKGLIDTKMRVKGTRNFVCSDEKKEHIYFWLVYDATIEELTGALREFGCFDALNLDAGLSTAFVYNNRYLIWPQKRNILDGIAIERKWLNLKEIEKIWENITKILIHDIEKRSRNSLSRSDELITRYMHALDTFRKNIYEKLSKDIMQRNIVWEYDKVGYKIEINNLNHLKLVTLVNEVYENLRKLRNEIRASIAVQN